MLPVMFLHRVRIAPNRALLAPGALV